MKAALALGLLVILTVASFFALRAPSHLYLASSMSGITFVHMVLPQAAARPGMMHYVEHLAWLNAMGADARALDMHSNAWTSAQSVGYWLSGPSEDLPTMMDMLARIFEPIDLPRDFADDELNIILREYDLRVANSITAQVNETLNTALYLGNLQSQSVIGTPEGISGFAYEDAVALHARTHRAEVARIVVAGDVSWLRAWWAYLWSDLPPGVGTEAVQPTPFQLGATETIVREFPNTEEAPRLVWRRVVRLHEPYDFDQLAAQCSLLQNSLDTALPGGIAQALRFDAAIARRFSLSIHPLDEQHVELTFSAVPDEGVSLTDLRDAFEDQLIVSAQRGILDQTYHRIRRRFEASLPEPTDETQVADWMAQYVLRRVAALREPLDERQRRRLVHDITLDSTNALLLQLADGGRTAIAFTGPEDRFE